MSRLEVFPSEGMEMATPTNVVNLDALIRRADLAAIGEQGDDIEVMSINGLEPGGMLYPALRKPDFQRETANWTPDGVADLIVTFAKRELIPALILWRSGQDVFVIDGAHRLSALIAWVHDDYGDGEISRKFFQNAIPEEQKRNAQRARDIVQLEVGSYDDHRKAITAPESARPDIRDRAARLGWERIFDLVNLVNRVSVKDSSHKRVSGDGLLSDPSGEATIAYLTNVRRVLRRICSTHPSSLGLHPALYFYSRGGTFQPSALLNYIVLFNDWDTPEFLKFTQVRAKFEEFIMSNPGITEAVRRLGSGVRSRPRVLSFYRRLITRLSEGVSPKDLAAEMAKDPVYDFLVAADNVADLLDEAGSFDRDVKGAAYIRQALPSAPKCPTCGGLMHRNGMQVGHKKAKRAGGSGTLANAGMQHPFCNSTVDN